MMTNPERSAVGAAATAIVPNEALWFASATGIPLFIGGSPTVLPGLRDQPAHNERSAD